MIHEGHESQINETEDLSDAPQHSTVFSPQSNAPVNYSSTCLDEAERCIIVKSLTTLCYFLPRTVFKYNFKILNTLLEYLYVLLHYGFISFSYFADKYS